LGEEEKSGGTGSFSIGGGLKKSDSQTLVLKIKRSKAESWDDKEKLTRFRKLLPTPASRVEAKKLKRKKSGNYKGRKNIVSSLLPFVQKKKRGSVGKKKKNCKTFPEQRPLIKDPKGFPALGTGPKKREGGFAGK